MNKYNDNNNIAPDPYTDPSIRGLFYHQSK